MKDEDNMYKTAECKTFEIFSMATISLPPCDIKNLKTSQ